MRLDKFLSHHLGISRTLVARELKASYVTIDDHVIKSGAYQINSGQVIKYQDNIIEHIDYKRYFMLHKPKGYVCSTDDPDYPTIAYFIDEPMAEKLHAAGRLDLDTTGLVLLTDDGQWSHRITSPKHHCEKTYLVTLAEPLSCDLIDIFAKGILLKGEKNLTKPAKLNIIAPTHASLTISEGRYHQVKRMFAAVGNHVVSLHRQQIGLITLDIAEGEYRPLTEAEINSIN
ncbi:16S rRNA pseudouridine(516) synthase RsuA [Orbus sturtevantii]|uniref:16S rRNA pseudouridine(516) synthase RsuA n=1 Tax=Orbus sturtevantii TaxID=3074109 RepID=UPI00370D48F0